MVQSFIATVSWLLCLLAAPVVCGAAANASTPFVAPDALKSDVAFWVRIYSELDSSVGLIHDTDSLEVVYELTSGLPPEFSEERRGVVEARTRFYRDRLQRLADSGVTADTDDERILKLWKGRAAARDLRRAAESVRFQSGQAQNFRRGLERAGAWRPQIERMLSEAELPNELAALPHVESSFDPGALSKSGAVGLWQFMRSTARLYIRVDDRVDERLDPLASTGAAIEYFRGAHQRLESWPLAVVAYNHGVNGMARARAELGTTDIVHVLRSYQAPSFKFASRNFYPSFLAALEVERRAEEFFGRVATDAQWRTCDATIHADVAIDRLASLSGHSVQVLKALNPALRPAVWAGKSRVPAGYVLRLPAETAPDPAQSASVPFYIVKPGDTLTRISVTSGMPVQEIAALNELVRPDRINVGQRLQLTPGFDCPACGCSRTDSRVAAIDAAASNR